MKRAARHVGVELSPLQVDLLGRYGEWLATEAVAGGGIGPGEPGRIADRHLADALVFAAAWDVPPANLLDIGSGVGLPGIPLGIAAPSTRVTLLDRSGRRCHLARRAVRILGLDNVEVEQGDAETIEGTWDAVVFRAAFPPEEAFRVALPLLSGNGVAVVGFSRRAAPDEAPAAPGTASVDVLEIGPPVLDSPAWLLRMKSSYPPSTIGSPT